MRKNILPIIMVVIVTCLFAGCEKRREDFYKKAVEYYEQEKFTESRLELKNALSLAPECAECRLLYGKLALEEGNFQNAFINFRYAADFDDKLTEAKVELSKLYLLAGEFDNAGDMARKALNEDSKNIDARLVLASVLAENKKYDESERMLDIARNEAPANPDVYLSLSSVYVRQKKMKEAEKALVDGVNRIPSNTALLMKIAAFYRKTDEPEKAKEFIEKLLEAGGGEPRFIIFAAEYYSSINDKTRAEELMSDLVKSFPDKDEYRVLYARLLSADKKADLTEKVLKEGLALNSASLQLRSALSGLYISLGRQEEAVKVLMDGTGIDEESADNVVYRKQLATLFLDMNEGAKALAQLDQVIERNPKDSEAHYLRGQIYLLEGKGQNAVAEFRQVVRDNPESAPAYVLLAKGHLANDETSIAIENLKAAIAIDPGYGPAREVLINTYLDRKNWHQAILELQRLKDKRPDDINIIAAIGDVYAIKGDVNLATHTFTEIARDFPDSPVGLMKLAELARKEGKNSAAQKYYTAALKIAPDSLVAIQGKVSVLLAQNKYTAAIKFCNGLLAKYPDNARIYEIMGRIQARRGNFDKAETYYSRAIDLAPEWMLPYMRIGDLYVANEKTKAGIAKFSGEVEKDGDAPGPQFILGLLYEQNGEFDKARKAYSDLLQKRPGFQLAANNLAYLLATKFSDNGDDMKEALKLARVAAGSQSPEALDTLGYVLFLNGEYEQALHVLNSALQIVPDFSAAQYHKALVYFRNNKKADAKKILTKIMNTPGDFPEKKEALNLLERM
ncbi:tetratricopeptide repeat protein [Maridesulfovibrio hydrothermalis]|uniref:Tetratricopeptide TPR_2 repeat protein n=1 Tax=Maridesulfovibrio hydrothermalis AM13 = DSM 14728 TaxID=1121451 RepID=L0RF45_9BACT|nr:tetratricopeptide repeat protein [Maridesulfovibrio hydrothermalis]CCO24832.1 Tetratricopeptide TPR_2 repeat protein [Maridesulfovibrio hydrothermalis AM13 = DSM 14728]